VKIVFLTFNYFPDIGACAFRAVSLVEAFSKKMSPEDELHVITTHPHRYKSYSVKAKYRDKCGKINIYRIKIPSFQSGILSQIIKFIIFSFKALFLCYRLKPDFIIGTTSRLMTGILSFIFSVILKCDYFLDLRDIFSETISDLVSSRNLLLARLLKKIFLFIETRIFQNACGVSVVSEAFLNYFKIHKLDVSDWSFYPNGIDSEFLNFDFSPSFNHSNKKIVVYAGNIGSGQSLEKIVPDLAIKLKKQYIFKIIGDGVKKKLLAKQIETLGIKNIHLIPPVSRKELLKFYEIADILFLHLNDIPAFERVLPSKIFEYISLGKPIVGGIRGYSANFIAGNISHFRIFKPGDITDCLKSFKSLENVVIDSSEVKLFKNNFSREKIMSNLADHIIKKFKSSLELNKIK